MATSKKQESINEIGEEINDAKTYDYRNPLNEEVDKKGYAKQNHSGFSPEQLNTPIPEPKMKAPPPPPPPPSANDDAPTGSSQGDDPNRSNPFNAGNINAGSKPVNPRFSEMSEGERNKSAAHAAAMTIAAYEKVTTFLPYEAVKISKRRLSKLESEGKIDLDMPFPMRRGTFIPTSEFIDQFNKAQKELFYFPQELKDEAMPLLEEIYAKKGIGASPEQRLLFIGIQHMANVAIVTKIAMDDRKELLNGLINYTAEMRQRRMNNMPPPPMQEHQPAPEQPMSKPEVEVIPADQPAEVIVEPIDDKEANKPEKANKKREGYMTIKERKRMQAGNTAITDATIVE